MGDETFHIAEAKGAKDGRPAALEEYLPKGQTFANWRKLVSVRRFPEIASPKDYVEKMVAEYRRQYPAMKFEAGKGPGGLYYMDCIMYPLDREATRSADQFAEWNYFVARPAAAGIIVYQYAERFAEDFEAADVKALRTRMLPILRKSVFVSGAGK